MQMKFSDGQSVFSRVFSFAILWHLRKLNARKKLVFYSTFVWLCKCIAVVQCVSLWGRCTYQYIDMTLQHCSHSWSSWSCVVRWLYYNVSIFSATRFLAVHIAWTSLTPPEAVNMSVLTVYKFTLSFIVLNLCFTVLFISSVWFRCCFTDLTVSCYFISLKRHQHPHSPSSSPWLLIHKILTSF